MAVVAALDDLHLPAQRILYRVGIFLRGNDDIGRLEHANRNDAHPREEPDDRC